MTEQMRRPALGKLEVGQRVMVRRSSNDARGRKNEDLYTSAEITKIGRVWVDLEGPRRNEYSSPRQWRMRIDTQDEGDRQYTQNNASFVTREQYRWEVAYNRARDTLRDHGISLTGTSRWNGREVELAKIINAVVAEREDGS